MRGSFFTVLGVSILVSHLAGGSDAYAFDSNGPSSFSIPKNVTFLTGDSWEQSGYIIRLYGVQACLRGKTYTDHGGQQQDCGFVSLSMLAAIIRDTSPICAPIATVPSNVGKPATVIAVCKAKLGNQDIDLGSMMITQGFAFAAFANDGRPVYPPYLAQQAVAQSSRSGLWAFSDVPVPTIKN